MTIIIEQQLLNEGRVKATHSFDPDSNIRFQHPLKSEEFITPVELIALLNDNPHLLEQSGWLVASQCDGEDSPKTRWQRLLEHTASDAGHPKLKEILLKNESVKPALTTNRRASKSD